MYSLFSYLLTYQINKLLHPKIYHLKGEKSLSLYYRAVALRKDAVMSGEKHEEIPRSSDALFGNNPKVFELPLFSSTSLEDLVRKSKIMGWLVTYYAVIYIPKCSSTPFQPPAVSR